MEPLVNNNNNNNGLVVSVFFLYAFPLYFPNRDRKNILKHLKKLCTYKSEIVTWWDARQEEDFVSIVCFFISKQIIIIHLHFCCVSICWNKSRVLYKRILKWMAWENTSE